jgi:hypothetical protein
MDEVRARGAQALQPEVTGWRRTTPPSMASPPCAQVRKELAAAQELRLRQAEARARREGRAASRVVAPAQLPPQSRPSGAKTFAAAAASSLPLDAGHKQQQEALFRLRLIDECPRCGASMNTDDDDALEGHAEHLDRCNDAAAHKRHAAALAAREATARTAASKAELAAEAAALAQVRRGPPTAWERQGLDCG